MAKKNKISTSELITFYMDYVIEHRCKPKSIEDFVKLHKFSAAEFYEHFSSFKDLEKTIYNVLFEIPVIASFEELKSIEGFPSDKIDRIALYLSL